MLRLYSCVCVICVIIFFFFMLKYDRVCVECKFWSVLVLNQSNRIIALNISSYLSWTLVLFLLLLLLLFFLGGGYRCILLHAEKDAERMISFNFVNSLLLQCFSTFLYSWLFHIKVLRVSILMDDFTKLYVQSDTVHLTVHENPVVPFLDRGCECFAGRWCCCCMTVACALSSTQPTSSVMTGTRRHRGKWLLLPVVLG